MTYDLLTPAWSSQMMAVLIRLQPGERRVTPPLLQPNEQWMFVLEGQLCINVDGVAYTLDRHDGICHDHPPLHLLLPADSSYSSPCPARVVPGILVPGYRMGVVMLFDVHCPKSEAKLFPAVLIRIRSTACQERPAVERTLAELRAIGQAGSWTRIIRYGTTDLLHPNSHPLPQPVGRRKCRG